MAEKEINPINFVKERASEIQLIEAAIESNRKKSMMFQRLPFYLRRRPKSHEKRKKRKRSIRKKDRHGLRTHTWYAKRFEMLSVWNTAIPLRRRMKSSKFIYKSQHRGFIFDESYKKVILYNRPKEQVLGIEFSLENTIQRIVYERTMFEAVVTNEYLIIILIDFGMEERLRSSNLIECGRIECCLSVIKADGLFSNEGNEDVDRFSKFSPWKRVDVDSVIKNNLDEVIYFRSLSDTESGKILLKRKRVPDFWQDIVNTGIIPVCVEELQRIGLENGYIVYPFDYPNTGRYKEFEEGYVKPVEDKYNRTPKSKKMKIDTKSMYIHTEENIILAMFELEKGSADRSAFVFDDDRIVGRVVRGAFCFSNGLCGGVCYLFKDTSEGDEFYTKNLNSKHFNQIKIIKVFRS